MLLPGRFAETCIDFTFLAAFFERLSFEVLLIRNSLKWLVPVCALSRPAEDHRGLEKSFCTSLFELLLSAVLRQFPFPLFPQYCVKGIIRAESDKVHDQENSQLASSFSCGCSLCSVVKAVLDHKHIRAGQASRAHPGRLLCRYESRDPALL